MTKIKLCGLRRAEDIETANALQIPLEINLLGLSSGRHYPNETFWKLAGEMGATAILGCDAHTAAALNDPKVLADGRALAAKYGLRVIDTMAL